MTTDKKLHLIFEDARGEEFNLTIDDPKEDLTDDEVIAQAGVIISANVFDSKGSDLQLIKKAYTREVVRTDIL